MRILSRVAPLLLALLIALVSATPASAASSVGLGAYGGSAYRISATQQEYQVFTQFAGLVEPGDSVTFYASWFYEYDQPASDPYAYEPYVELMDAPFLCTNCALGPNISMTVDDVGYGDFTMPAVGPYAVITVTNSGTTLQQFAVQMNLHYLTPSSCHGVQGAVYNYDAQSWSTAWVRSASLNPIGGGTSSETWTAC